MHLLHILCSGAGARTQPFSHYYIHEDGRTFSCSKHTRAIKPWGMIRRKKANCRCISRSWSIFPLSPPCNQGQRPKKDLLSTSGNCKYYLDLTMQCDQRDNFFFDFLSLTSDPECQSPEVESNLVFPQDLVRVVKLEQEVDLRR